MVDEVETRCPACGKGIVERVIVSRTYTVDGKRVSVDGLMPDKCSACSELTWSEAELRRADEAIAITLRKAVAESLGRLTSSETKGESQAAENGRAGRESDCPARAAASLIGTAPSLRSSTRRRR